MHRAPSLTSAWARLFQRRRLQKHQRGGEAMTLGSVAWRGCFQGAGLPPGRGSKVRARPSSRRGEAAAPARRSACARRAAAAAPCRGSPAASAHRSRRRLAAGRLLPLGARLRGCRGGRSGIRAGGAGGSGAWTRLPAAPGSGSPRRLL